MRLSYFYLRLVLGWVTANEIFYSRQPPARAGDVLVFLQSTYVHLQKQVDFFLVQIR